MKKRLFLRHEFSLNLKRFLSSTNVGGSLKNEEKKKKKKSSKSTRVAVERTRKNSSTYVSLRTIESTDIAETKKNQLDQVKKNNTV